MIVLILVKVIKTKDKVEVNQWIHTSQTLVEAWFQQERETILHLEDKDQVTVAEVPQEEEIVPDLHSVDTN